VAIYRLLQNSAFEPEDIERLASAYEMARRALKLKDRNDPITDTVARKIIDVAQTGEKDPERICAQAIERIRYR
jgi:hypothetical protein